MSDNEKSSSKGWSDRERFVYLFALMEQTGGKLDYKNTPRPVGRSEIACQRMVERLKVTLKDDLEAFKTGVPIAEATPKKTPKTTSKTTPKRKAPAKTADEADGEGSPKKRGRKKKADVEVQVKAEETTGEIKAEQTDDEIKAEEASDEVKLEEDIEI